MSLTASFYSALSGLDTNSTALQVISDNIANLNTAGFKGSSVQFEDVLGQSLTTVSGAYGIGVGTKISSVDDNFTQGTLDTTNVGTDVAANGKGFFILKDQGTDENYYTRAGHFYVDNTGYYVNSQGMRVQGYLYDNTGKNQVQTLADIKIDQSSMVAPKVTSAVNMGLNVNASDTNTTFNITNPGGTSSYSTALKIYDTLGNAHTITTYFSKEATPQTWQWNATIDGSDVSGGTAGTPVLFGSGTLTFNTSGALTSTMPENFYAGSGITFADGVAASADTIDFTGSTQFGSSSTIQTLNQDGYAAGTLSGVSVKDRKSTRLNSSH
jgi:flagellar hook protein FlgE